MAKIKVCVSFDYENDGRLRQLLAAWNANPNINFSFDDKTPNEIQSNDYSVVKGVLTKKISDATRLLVIVGQHATQRHPRWREIGDHNWMCWEINKAKTLNKKLVAVKVDRSYESPTPLYNSGASWAYSFTLDSITTALRAQ